MVGSKGHTAEMDARRFCRILTETVMFWVFPIKVGKWQVRDVATNFYIGF